MPRAAQPGFTLLEVLVALVLFATVLLSLLATGQLILARLFDADLKLRSAVYAHSIIDSLRGTACARLGSGSSSHRPMAASWTTTNLLDAMQVDVTIAVPQRPGGSTRSHHLTALLVCPEP